MNSTSREPDRPAAQQTLGTADRALMAVDQSLRALRFPGFDTQTLVWVSGRLDAAALRTALSRLGEQYPVVTSRLVKAGVRGRPCWQFRPGAPCPLQETDLGSDDEEAVWDRAAELLSTPCPPAQTDPIRFHLLHRSGSRDVFLMQYNHTLMDNNAAVRVLRRIDGCSRTAAPEETSAGERRDLVREYLRRFPREQRRQAAHRTLDIWRATLRGGATMLGQKRPAAGGERRHPAGGDPGGGPVRFRIAACRLERDEVRALRARVVGACGYPAVSMALVGSVFRALGRLAPRNMPTGAQFVAGIGIDLGVRGDRGPIFQNLTSLVPISAHAADLADREELMRMLSRQLRERLAAGCDLGMLQLVSVINRRPRRVRLVIDSLTGLAFSLWYAYFGPVDAVGDQFCGGAVEDVCYTGPSWSPLGLTLIVNQFRGHLLFQATYLPDCVPDQLARDFLSAVVADLV
jgi:hypothetical protein